MIKSKDKPEDWSSMDETIEICLHEVGIKATIKQIQEIAGGVEADEEYRNFGSGPPVERVSVISESEHGQKMKMQEQANSSEIAARESVIKDQRRTIMRLSNQVNDLKRQLGR